MIRLGRNAPCLITGVFVRRLTNNCCGKMASKKVDKSTLGFLGIEFQQKLVKCFFEDQTFFDGIVHIVDQNMFTDEHLRRIVGFMKDRYNFTGVVPTYGDVEIMIRANVSEAISVQYLLSNLKNIRDMDLSAMDLIEDTSEKFFKQQNLTKAMNAAIDIIKRGDFNSYYKIEKMVTDALTINTKQDLGFHIFDHVEADLSDEFRITIPTGADKLDDALMGGLGKGELGVIVCPSGVGKTSSTTGFAAFAATYRHESNNNKGFKVLHFFFEDTEPSIRRKYFGYILDMDASTLSLPDVRPIAINRLNENVEMKKLINENIIGKRLRNGEARVSDIRHLIDRHIALGFKPDLVIVDYFECLQYEKSDKSDSEWSREGATMRQLECMANELNVALWVPVQGTRDSLGAEFVGLSQAGGSVKKIQIAHVILTYAQTDEMKTQNRINVFLGKFRAGRITRNKFTNVKFNNGTCKFDMSDMDDDEDMDNVSFAKRQNELARRVVYQQRK